MCPREGAGARATARQALATAHWAGIRIVTRRALAVLSTVERDGG